MTPALPVDSALPRIHEALARHRAVVLVAAPGAGKTTRVPPSLVDAGRVLLLQPRRVAARAMAKRIAFERQWTVGREVGWHIRFERNFVHETRLLVVTEGILTAYLQQDPLLSDVATIVIDEFHERSVHADLGLALAKQAWLARSDLRIVVMSATLDPGPVSMFLGGCPIVDVPGTLHPMTTEYAPGESVKAALADVLPRTTGNVLCFLPGAREIDLAISDSLSVAAQHGVDLLPLHGSMESLAQDATLAPTSARRRAIIATNVAETSLTVSGVSVVIDTGLHKVARYDDERGVDSLTTERVTLDSADQRAGRAARLGPGTVRRLWDARDRLRPHREAEVHRVDLSAILLSIIAWGAAAESFEWFDRPDQDRIAAATSLLSRLGAIDGNRITDIGQLIQRMPLHPRLARVVIAGHGSFEACAAAADLADGYGAANLEQIARRLMGGRYRPHISDVELRRALLAGYPDRVAKRRSGDRVTLASGHGAVIGRDSGVHADWLIALDVTSGRTTATTQALIRKGSPIDPEWLSATRSELRHEFDRDTGSVKAHEVDWYDEIPLREHPVAPKDDVRARLLATAWLEREPDAHSARLLKRLQFTGADVNLRSLVAAAAMPARRLSDVALSEELLPWDLRQRLTASAPDRLTVPSGRDMTIEYADDGSVSVAVKLQELFGLAETPRVGPAAIPVTFHLLAPNGRPVQTTRDLRSFWERTYPEVRKELRGRYPKHPWPEDPWNAPPTHRTTRAGDRSGRPRER
ncbi:MAG: ATP-dependent helicase C-terminal domain-containing protein [Acidobacteriota bacterium]